MFPELILQLNYVETLVLDYRAQESPIFFTPRELLCHSYVSRYVTLDFLSLRVKSHLQRAVNTWPQTHTHTHAHTHTHTHLLDLSSRISTPMFTRTLHSFHTLRRMEHRSDRHTHTAAHTHPHRHTHTHTHTHTQTHTHPHTHTPGQQQKPTKKKTHPLTQNH